MTTDTPSNEQDAPTPDEVLASAERFAASERTQAGKRDAATAYVAEKHHEIRLALATLRHVDGRRHFKTRDLAEKLDTTTHQLMQVMPLLDDKGWVSIWSDASPTTWRVEL